MLYSLQGRLIEVAESFAAIETGDQNGSVAYEVLMPQKSLLQLPAIGSVVRIYTAFLVRENEFILVGFLTLSEKRLYETLLTVSGIGPRQGLKILSELSADEVRRAILAEDAAALSRVKGIGAKTASRMILELKDKMKKAAPDGASMPTDGLERKRMETLMAMRVLGYSDYESRPVIDQAFQDKKIAESDVETILKTVLLSIKR